MIVFVHKLDEIKKRSVVMPIYRNRDERLGDVYDIELKDVPELYRKAGWDIVREDGAIDAIEMTDNEIIEDFLLHDVERISL